MSDTAEVTRVSRGAEAIPWTTLITASEVKDYFHVSLTSELSDGPRTVVKYPQILVASRTIVDMTKNGRLPQILAPAAVKKVVNPIQNARKPMTRLATKSMLTLYFIAIRGRPGVTIGPSLRATSQQMQVSAYQVYVRGCYTRGEGKDDHDRLFPHRGPPRYKQWSHRLRSYSPVQGIIGTI